MQSIQQIISRQIDLWEQQRGEWSPSPRKPDIEPPHLPPVAISPQFGSGSREITEILSRRTGFEIYGFKLIDKMAENMEVRRQLVDRLDQRRRSYLVNMVDGLLVSRHVDHHEYARNLLETIQVFIMEGGCILLGRGATFQMKPGAGLRVRLVASRENRIANLKRFYEIERDEAEKRLETSDRERAHFIETYFGRDIDDPRNYDVVINTDRTPAAEAAGIIIRAMETMRTDAQGGVVVRRVRTTAEELLRRQIEKWDSHGDGTRAAIWDDAPGPESPQRLPVIAFSPEFCSGSRLIAESIHQRIGYEIFGYQIIDKVAEDMHLSPRLVDRLDQRAHSNIETLINRLKGDRCPWCGEYLEALIRVVRALILQGGVTLIGRGSAYVVEEGEGLRVRLVAPFDKRLANMKEFYGIEGRAAEERLRKGDAERLNFVTQYFRIDPEDLTRFDLVINTDRLAPASSAKIILRAFEPLLD